MAPAIGMTASPHNISRSTSTPNLASLSAYQRGTSGQQTTRQFDVPSFDTEFDLDTAFRNDAAPKSFTVVQPSSFSSMQNEPPPPPLLTRRRTGSLMDKSRQWLPLSKSVKENPLPATGPASRVESNETRPPASARSKSKTERLTSFSKWPWLPGSSPQPATTTSQNSDPTPVGTRRPGIIADRQAAANRWSEPTKSTPKSIARATSYFSKMKSKQPLVEKLAESDSGSETSGGSDVTPASSVAGVFSSKTSPEDNVFSPTTEDSFGGPTAQPTDPLWPDFKSIEIELNAMKTKTATQKVDLVKTTFIPFLSTTANHWSTKSLYPEDLDRRTQVLGAWWSEMLDMLDGTAVLKVDRPILYEALTTVMMRMEWRLTTPHFLSLADRNLRETLRCDSWGKGLPLSNEQDKPTTLIEAAEHSVRSTFIVNLVQQVVFAVEKASALYAPLPLMAFAGKTCAYAFFFVPGFAEVLACQWGLSQHQLKRTADELGVSSAPKTDGENLALFPPSLLSLAWTTPRLMGAYLRQKPEKPPSMPSLSWTGRWARRWKGLETDLFFVFCKYFYILSSDFTPAELPLADKAQTPAFILVQAQLLLCIDKLIHRRSVELPASDGSNAPAKGTTLINLVPGSETSSATAPPFSEMRMSDAAVILMLKDIMFDSSTDLEDARQTYAETFSRLMAGAVRKTSLFDSHACFTLCDLLEETLSVYDEFVWPRIPDQYDDWNFWLDVFKKMLMSLNTVTETRVLCFVFSVWKIITRDPARKASLCFDWLLSEEVFGAFYSHWCPLVRGYYHRLLCWRICRCEGDASELDLRIYNLAMTRLQTVGAGYNQMKQLAEKDGRLPPSTAPMLPAPGKRFMIIRFEPEETRPVPSQTFEQISRSTGAEVIFNDDDGGANWNAGSSGGVKKKKSLLDKVMAFSTGAGSSPGTLLDDAPNLRPPTRTGSWDEELKTTRRETAEARMRSPPSTSTPIFNSVAETSSTQLPATTPKPVNPFRFVLVFIEPTGPPQEVGISMPRLPLPAQKAIRLQQRPRSLSAPSSLVPPPPDFPPPVPPMPALPGVVATEDGPAESTDAASADPAVEKAPTNKAGNGPHVAASVNKPALPLQLSHKNAVYCGRALAEWALVVAECDHFAERRQQEGIDALKDIEVPSMTVDGSQGIGG